MYECLLKRFLTGKQLRYTLLASTPMHVVLLLLTIMLSLLPVVKPQLPDVLLSWQALQHPTVHCATTATKGQHKRDEAAA